MERTAAALGVFLRRGVSVIRIGLQASENLLCGEETVGGGYHEAVGEMAYSRYFKGALEKALIQQNTIGKYAEIRVHPTDLSKMIGQRGANRNDLLLRFSLRGIRFIPCEKTAKNEFSVNLID